MSVLGNALARLLPSNEKASVHSAADVRTATYMRPIIEKLLADDEDGDTYRAALGVWRHTERPPLAIYDGDVSRCQIDGPLQLAGDHPLPLGGIIYSPGITVRLDPFEASDLRDQLRAAIERAILTWLADNGRRDASSASIAFDRRTADREAKAMIADWVARKEAKRPVGKPVAKAPDHV